MRITQDGYDHSIMTGFWLRIDFEITQELGQHTDWIHIDTDDFSIAKEKAGELFLKAIPNDPLTRQNVCGGRLIPVDKYDNRIVSFRVNK